MRNLVEAIHRKDFTTAKEILAEELRDVIQFHMNEMKKLIASTLTEEDNKVVSLAGEKDKRELGKFHRTFMGDVKKRAEEMKDIIRSHIETGKFTMKVGDRFSTEHSRKNGHAPFEVTGYHVDTKNPDRNYGYHVRRDTPDGEEKSMVMVRSINGEKLHGPEKWAQLQAGFKKFEPLKVVSEARIRIIKARIRNGKVQRRKKISNVTGYTLRGGGLIKMSPAERRRRKLGARKAKIKRRAKLSRSLMKRKKSLMRRKSMGL